MTACDHFQMGLYVRREPCKAGIDNFGKLDDWPCVVYGRGLCDEHATATPLVKTCDLPNYEAGFDSFNQGNF